MRQLRRATSAFLAAALAALAIAGGAEAKSFSLPEADVSVRVTKDGSLVVDEHITVRLQRAVHRRLPRDPPPQWGVGRRRAGERERPFLPSRRLHRAQVRRCARHVRHDRGRANLPHRLALPALDELRTFRVHYRLAGVAVAYDDVVDVNLQVWGSEWEEPLDRLTATETAPGRILRAWGHPVYVRGDVQIRRQRRSCARSTSRPGSSSSCAR